MNEQKYADSLKLIITKKILPRNQKAKTLFLLSEFYKDRDSFLAREYLTESRNYIKDPLIKAKYNYYAGIFYSNINKEKASEYLKKAIDEFSKSNLEESDCFQASSWYNYASLQKDKEGFTIIVKNIIEKSIPLVQKHNNQIKIGHFYTLLGTFLTLNSEFKKAEIYFLKGQKILETNAPNSPELYNNYITISNAYCYQSNLKAAQHYLDKAWPLISNYTDSSYYTSFIYSQTLVYMVSRENEKALSETISGIKLSEKFGNKNLLQFFLLQKCDILIELKRYKEAESFLGDLIKTSPLAKNEYIRIDMFRRMINIYEQLGNDKKALEWSKRYLILNDSVNNQKFKYETSLLETQYRTAEKEKEIAQNRIEISRQSRYMWVLGLSTLLLLSSAVFLYIHYKNKQILAIQKEINMQQLLTAQLREEEIKITKALLEGEEYERDRIAKELHDGVGGLFTGIKINLSAWGAINLPSNSQNGFDKILGQLDYSLDELRRVAENILPVSLMNHGLEEALKDLCSFFTTDKVKVEFQAMNIDNAIAQKFQLNIYRIIQELLTNAIKHSKANNIFIQCTYYNHKVFLISVEDNGIGFNNKPNGQYTGKGLLNIQKRINFMRGKMEIHSREHEGTSINIELLTTDSNG